MVDILYSEILKFQCSIVSSVSPFLRELLSPAWALAYTIMDLISLITTSVGCLYKSLTEVTACKKQHSQNNSTLDEPPNRRVSGVELRFKFEDLEFNVSEPSQLLLLSIHPGNKAFLIVVMQIVTPHFLTFSC